MDLTALLPSRLQFAFTIIVHRFAAQQSAVRPTAVSGRLRASRVEKTKFLHATLTVRGSS
jgi:hypothetical protein